MNNRLVRSITTMCVCLTTAFVSAGRVTYSLPQPSGYGDTESSNNPLFAGWDELTRHMTIAVDATDVTCLGTNWCVQVALGKDANVSETLEFEETDLVLGYDCGKWFIRDERTGEESTVHCSTSTFTFDLSSLFDRDWNAARITTRGTSIPAAQIAAEFKNNPMCIVIR